MSTLRTEFDALLLDLDGTVYRGAAPVEHAVAALTGSAQRLVYVTNNASRRPPEVAAHLVELGLEVAAADVVTSAQAGARVLAERVDAGSAVLVVGAQALAEEVEHVGLLPVRQAGPEVVAVVQGHSPHTGWEVLAEASLAIRGGALWVATNIDATLALERGIVPGNGAMVAAVRVATGAEPIVAGKPARPLMDDAIARASSRTPLVVGDRLDTDIAGAGAVGAASLFVLTGVHTVSDLLHAPAGDRPTHVAADLRALDRPAAESAVGPVDRWSVHRDGADLVVRCADADADPVAGLRAACAAAWQRPSVGTVRAEGAGAVAALRAWGLAER